jgi:hypothetical protein
MLDLANWQFKTVGDFLYLVCYLSCCNAGAYPLDNAWSEGTSHEKIKDTCNSLDAARTRRHVSA